MCGFGMADKLEHCGFCGEEARKAASDIWDGRTLCEACENDKTDRAELEAASVIDEPVWYTLSEVIGRIESSDASPSLSKWQELMALAQILHDLRIHDSNLLLRKLGAVYVADDSKPLRGEYHYIDNQSGWVGELGAGHSPKEAKEEPRMSSRRQAIMAQKERKNESP